MLAVAYSALLSLRPGLVGSPTFEGALGVVLGLYICSHPAANAVDLLFLPRGALRQASSEWSGVGWLALNLLVLLAGWFVIATGTTRLVG